MLFRMTWVFLHRNLSGKYRVTPLAGAQDVVQPLARDPNAGDHRNGVYLAPGDLRSLRRVELVESDADATDFWIANGQFVNNEYELLSYVTNDKKRHSATAYSTRPAELATSQTQGFPELDAISGCFTNLPQPPAEYVDRHDLQATLRDMLRMERHEVVTLKGSGGVGKTTLALRVLHALVREDDCRFTTVLWFSARDVDLLPSGPRPVRPEVVTLDDVSSRYASLVGPPREDSRRAGETRRQRAQRARDALQAGLAQGEIGPTLFVFDNFETVDTPAEFYQWLDRHIRSPNKVLITTRIRDFKGDYPVHVGGLHDSEAIELVDTVAKSLRITHLIGPSYRSELLKASYAHPYVIKILLGEVQAAQRAVKPRRIIASQDEVLTALFERTYNKLSPAARKVFLTLANWRSAVPELALEAVLLRSAKEGFDVEDALEELYRYSLAEAEASTSDDQGFVVMPLAAAEFGRRKLRVSPLKSAVEVDTEWLRLFGPTQREDVRHGVTRSLRRLMKHIAEEVSVGRRSVEEYVPTLEFMARRVPDLWLDMERMYSELEPGAISKRRRCLRQYLEVAYEKKQALLVWQRLRKLCAEDSDQKGEVHALVEICEAPGVAAHEISAAANRLNSILKRRQGVVPDLDSEERNGMLRRVAKRMERVAASLDADDFSRLGWLYVQLDMKQEAVDSARRGLERDADNVHCVGLLEKFSP